MEHIFSLMVIGVVLVGMICLWVIAELAIRLLGKMFPNLEDKLVDIICR